MQLTRFTDLGLRVLMYVAHAESRSTPVTRPELARFYRVSAEHLRKVIHRLAAAGLLATVAGRGGGMRLGRAARTIRLGTVVAVLEPDLAIVDCAKLQCVLRGPCSLKTALDEAARAFVAALDRYSLADVLAQPAMKAQVLRLVRERRAAAPRDA
ncbi:MAG: Rrf2 family transcriptional regulator [Burkholderiaceae bacterium]